MLELSKCQDFVVNRGHYFGTEREFDDRQAGLIAVPEDVLATGVSPRIEPRRRWPACRRCFELRGAALADARRRRPRRTPSCAETCDCRRRLGRRRRDGRRAAGGSRLRVLLLEAGGERATRAARRLRRAGVPPLRDRERRRCAGTSSSATTPTTSGRRARPEVRRDRDGRRVDGVLYPRAGTLGGCTAHNAMIFVYPHDSDWDGIARAHRRRRPGAPTRCAATSSGSSTAGYAIPRAAGRARHRPDAATAGTAGCSTEQSLTHGCRCATGRWPRSCSYSAESARSRATRPAARRSRCAPAIGPRRPERLATGRGQLRGRALHAADHADGHRRSARASGCSTSRPAHPDRLVHRARRAGDAVLFDDAQARHRRRVPEGRAPLPRRPDAAARSRASSRERYRVPRARSSSPAAPSTRRSS